MIQPRFMNVDIRIIVDVTQGALDLFLSPRDDTFVVNLNSSTGFQEVYLIFNLFTLVNNFDMEHVRRRVMATNTKGEIKNKRLIIWVL